jgi:predicted DNA-binding transcriptional regulator AlpA
MDAFWPIDPDDNRFTAECDLSHSACNRCRRGCADPLLTAEDVAAQFSVSVDWVWDHSSRKLPILPVIRMSGGVLRYRASQIEEFLKERERASNLRKKRR